MQFDVEDIDDDVPQPSEPALTAPAPSAFMVQISGLAKRTDLNGLFGVATEYDAHSDRYRVLVLGSREKVNIRPANLSFGNALNSMSGESLKTITAIQEAELARRAAPASATDGASASFTPAQARTAAVSAGVPIPAGSFAAMPQAANPAYHVLSALPTSGVRPLKAPSTSVRPAIMTAEAKRRKAEERERLKLELIEQKRLLKEQARAQKAQERHALQLQRDAEKAAAREQKLRMRERMLQEKERARELEREARDAARAAERDAREVERCVADMVRRVEIRLYREARAEEAERVKTEARMERQMRADEKARREEAEAKIREEAALRRREQRPVVYTQLNIKGIGVGSARVCLELLQPSEVREVPMALSLVANRLFREYDAAANTEPFGRSHRWVQMIRGAEAHLQAAVGPKYNVRSSMGCGRWAFVPWLVVADPGESTQHGLYLQYLFAADMSSVYLCLGQGTSKLKVAFGHAAAIRHLNEVANFVRTKCRELLEPGSALHTAGFDLNGKIDLRAGGSSTLAAQYEQGVIVSQRYDAKDGMPAEAELIRQLRCMLDLYSRVLQDNDYIENIVKPSDAKLATVYGEKLRAIHSSFMSDDEEEGEEIWGDNEGMEGVQEREDAGEDIRATIEGLASAQAAKDEDHSWIRQPSKAARRSSLATAPGENHRRAAAEDSEEDALAEVDVRLPRPRGRLKQHDRVWFRLSGVYVRPQFDLPAPTGKGTKRGRSDEIDATEEWFEAQRKRSRERRLMQRERSPGVYNLRRFGGSTPSLAEPPSPDDSDTDLQEAEPITSVETAPSAVASPPDAIKACSTFEKPVNDANADDALAGTAPGQPEVLAASTQVDAEAVTTDGTMAVDGGLAAGPQDPCLLDGGAPETPAPAPESGALSTLSDDLESLFDPEGIDQEELDGILDEQGGLDEESDAADEGASSTRESVDDSTAGAAQQDAPEATATESGSDGVEKHAESTGEAASGTQESRRSPIVGVDRKAVRLMAERARAIAAAKAGVALELSKEPSPNSPSFVTEVEGLGKLLLSTRNSTGYQGVFTQRDKFKQHRVRYVTLLNFGGVTKMIGTFSSALEAAICYTRRKQILDAKSLKCPRRPRTRKAPCSLLPPIALEHQHSRKHEVLAAAEPTKPAQQLPLQPMEVEDL